MKCMRLLRHGNLFWRHCGDEGMLIGKDKFVLFLGKCSMQMCTEMMTVTLSGLAIEFVTLIM